LGLLKKFRIGFGVFYTNPTKTQRNAISLSTGTAAYTQRFLFARSQMEYNPAHMPPRVVFMGSPEFALPVLRSLAGSFPVVGVVTQPDRAAGRGRELKPPPVKRLALELGIPVLQPEKLRLPEAMQALRSLEPELIVVAAFGQILKPEVLDLPAHGCLNVHASLLPRWRGAAPINAAILAGDEKAGVTIMKMDPGMDTGPTLNQRAIKIQPGETAGELYARLATLGAELLMETLPAYLEGRLAALPQPDEGVTYAPMLKKEQGLLDFQRPAQELERQVRAFNPWPGAYFEWAGAPLKVHRAHVETGPAAPGKTSLHNGQPAIGTSEGVLVLDEVQPAGKRPMAGKAFLAGVRRWGA
jgi:methionyl-tRNA formyltransferase